MTQEFSGSFRLGCGRSCGRLTQGDIRPNLRRRKRRLPPLPSERRGAKAGAFAYAGCSIVSEGSSLCLPKGSGARAGAFAYAGCSVVREGSSLCLPKGGEQKPELSLTRELSI